MKAPKNTLTGYVEKAHISAFQFENQRRTFHTYGYALDPSIDGEAADGQNYVGDLQSAYDTDGKTVFESPRTNIENRKRLRNDKPEDVTGFAGPWAKFENEITVSKPTEKEKAELDEMLAKKHRRNNKVPEEEKAFEEKSVLHSKLILYFYSSINY